MLSDEFLEMFDEPVSGELVRVLRARKGILWSLFTVLRPGVAVTPGAVTPGAVTPGAVTP